ncbi:MAG TPA: hypothetical protein VG328_05155 [Stellaceae bacterium]|jgi:hypothetical protein|nr:hypothetical protein [Stellaceae bacterium]
MPVPESFDQALCRFCRANANRPLRMAELRINKYSDVSSPMIKHSLCERLSHNYELIRGLSCDEHGVFLAGDVPLIYRGSAGRSGSLYVVRHMWFVRGPNSKFCWRQRTAKNGIAQVASLQLIARYMNEKKWALAKIASVQLRLPEISDDLGLAKLLATEAGYLAKRCSSCGRKSDHKSRAAGKATFRRSRVFPRAKVVAANGRATVVTSDS